MSSTEESPEKTELSNVVPTRLTLSPSKLSSFTKCGRNYRFHYLDKLPDPPTEATVKGNIVHRALELFYGAYGGGLLTSANLDKCVDEAITEHDGAIAEVLGLAPSAELEAECYHLAQQIFLVESPAAVEVLSTELRIHEVIGDYEMRGIIDRVDDNGDGTATLVDYKSGKVPSKRDVDDRMRAMHVYAHLWNETHPRPAKYVKLIYLKGTPKRQKPVVFTAEVTPQRIAFALKRTIAIGDAIEEARANNFFGASPSPLCPWCPYTDRCIEGQEWMKAHGKEPAA